MRQEQWLRPLRFGASLFVGGALVLGLSWRSASAAQESSGSQDHVPSNDQPHARPATRLTLCLPAVDSDWQRRNASLDLLASFKVGGDGSAEEVEILRDHEAFQSSDLIECISQWELGGWDVGEKVYVGMYWQHGYGWEYLQIVRPDESLRIALPRHLALGVQSQGSEQRP